MFVGWEPLAPGRNDGSFPIVCSPSSDLTLKCSIPAIRSSATKIGETQQLFSKPAINPHPMQQIHCFTTLQHSLRAQKKSCQCNKSPTRCNEYGFLGATNRHPYCNKSLLFCNKSKRLHSCATKSLQQNNYPVATKKYSCAINHPQLQEKYILLIDLRKRHCNNKNISCNNGGSELQQFKKTPTTKPIWRRSRRLVTKTKLVEGGRGHFLAA